MCGAGRCLGIEALFPLEKVISGQCAQACSPVPTACHRAAALGLRTVASRCPTSPSTDAGSHPHSQQSSLIRLLTFYIFLVVWLSGAREFAQDHICPQGKK